MVHGSVHGLLRLIGGLAMVLLIGLAALAWRLSNGPISVDFLAPYVAQAISVEGEVSFKINRAAISWDGVDRSPQIRVLDITAVNGDDQVIGVFPEMNVRLSLLSVLEGAPAPQDITLINPIIRITRRLDGSVFFGLDPSRVAPNTSTEIVRSVKDQEQSQQLFINLLVRALSTPGGSTNLAGYLDSAAIRNASVVFLDRMTEAEWLVPSGQIELLRDGDGVKLQARLPYLNDEGTSDVLITGTYGRNDNSLMLTVTFDNVKTSSLKNLVPDTPLLDGVELEVSGTLDLQISLEQPLPKIETVRVAVVKGSGLVSLPAPIQRDYSLSKVALMATASEGLDQVEVQELALTVAGAGGSSSTLKMVINGEKIRSTPKVSAQIQIDTLALVDLQSFWPEAIKPNTLKWIQANLRNGVVTNAEFDAELSGLSLFDLEVSKFSGQADLDAFQVRYISLMPPVESVSGRLFLGLSEVSIDVYGGEVIGLDTGGKLSVQSGRVRLFDLDRRPQKADIDLIVLGDLRDAMSLIDEEPLGYATQLGISPLSTSGEAEVLLGFDFPLLQKLGLEDVKVTAQAKLENATVDNAVFELPLEAGQFSLSLNNQALNVIGTASLGGIPTGLTWRENFSSAPYKRQYALDAVVGNEQRPLIRLSSEFLQPPYVDGPVRIEAIYTVGFDNVADLSIEADLKSSRLSLPQLNWSKPSGVDALFAADIKIEDQTLQSIDSFSIRSDLAELDVVGSVQFSENSQVEVFEIDRGLIGKSNLGLELERQSDGSLDIQVDGAVLDGRAFWRSLQQNDQSRAFQRGDSLQPSLTFNGRVESLILSENGEVKEVSALVHQNELGISEVSLTAKVDESNLFQFSLDTDGGDLKFQAQSENGGALLKSLGLGDDFIGGDLDITGTIQRSGAVDGVFNINAFRLVDAPLLARLLSVASLTGIVDELNGGGISFSELNLPFSFSENIFSINNGAMYGASLGLTARGSYYIDQDIIEGEGTLIPAYAVNSAMGSIPILGPLLTGGEKSGGVFAATYAIRGNPEGGEITVNPLATLTPGFLRQIFRVFDPPPAQSSVSSSPEASELAP